MRTINIKSQEYQLDKYGLITNQDGSALSLSTDTDTNYEIHSYGLMYYLVFYAIKPNHAANNYKLLADNSFYLNKGYINLLLFTLLIECYFRGSDTQSKFIFTLQHKTKQPYNTAIYISSWINALRYIKAHYTEALSITYINR